MSSKTSAAVSSVTHPSVGTFIDGDSLELVEVLGVGGYGVVYRAVDARSPCLKSYAVKCLVSQPHQTARQRQIHIREIALHQIASSHPGVVTLHRVIEDANRTFIIMDYAPDHDLFTQILHSCRYLGDDALIKHVFLQLLDAVEFCHNLGIYHRDLKPENVLCFDDGLRVAITDFGLATTDKLSEEFRTGSVYHMSPECQGGVFAPTGNYSPMSNDIWSLGIILLNLATGRNPWKSATPDDQTFQAYLRDPLGFLPTVLPISPEINNILTHMLEVDWRERMTLREVRNAVEEVGSFYADGVVFEGSMARCPWESGMDIDSDSSEDTKEEEEEEVEEEEAEHRTPPLLPQKSDTGFVSRWSKDSSSDIIFASHSVADDSSYGAPWTNFSSCGATWDFESPTSSVSPRDSLDKGECTSTPVSPASSSSAGGPSLPVTPNSIDLVFGERAGTKLKLPQRKGLTIETNFAAHPPRYYNSNPNPSMATSSFSTGTSMMQTAVEYGYDDPYSPSFFLTSAVTASSAANRMTDVSAISVDDKEMVISPSEEEEEDWASSATEMSSPSVYTSSTSTSSSSSGGGGGGSVDSRDMAFTRSTTPSPDTVWSSSYAAAQQPSQHSPSVFLAMTDVCSASRLSNIAPASLVPQHPLQQQQQQQQRQQKSLHEGSKYKTASIFNPIKFFPRASPPPSLPPPPTPTPPPAVPAPSYTNAHAYTHAHGHAHGRHSSEPYTTAPPGNKAGPQASIPLTWTLLVPHSYARGQPHLQPKSHPQPQGWTQHWNPQNQVQDQNQDQNRNRNRGRGEDEDREQGRRNGKAEPRGGVRLALQDRRVSPFRSPRYWFMPGRFFASTGAQ